jgi:hypothetical protein
VLTNYTNAPQLTLRLYGAAVWPRKLGYVRVVGGGKLKVLIMDDEIQQTDDADEQLQQTIIGHVGSGTEGW